MIVITYNHSATIIRISGIVITYKISNSTTMSKLRIDNL